MLFGGDEENRTPDPLLARQVLSQLSYTPKLGLKVVLSDFFSLSAFAPAFPSFSYENESQLSYTPKGDFYSLMESPALRASSFKIEQQFQLRPLDTGVCPCILFSLERR